jgi:hypothetical protein
MSTVMRFFWLVTLGFFVGGCSSYRVVSPPRIEDEAERAVGWESSVKVGDDVRITLTDNGKVEGRIMSISSEALTLEPIEPFNHTKYTENIPSDILPRVIAADSIWVLEKRSPSHGKSSLLVVGIIGGVLGLLAIAVAASGGFW